MAMNGRDTTHSPDPASGLAAMFAQARQLHMAGRLGEAEPLYRRILAADPRHADALHLLGVMAFQLGRSEQAAAMIREAIAINGEVANYHSNLGNALKETGRQNEAVTAYQVAIRLKPDFAEAYSNMSAALSQAGRLTEAAAAGEEAIRLKPDFAQAHSNLGGALHGLGRFEAAIDAFSAAVRLQPDLAMAHCNLGNALKGLNRLDDAVAAYAEAIRREPDFPEAHFNLADALEEQGRLEEAILCYQQAIRCRPDFAQAHSNLLMTLHYQSGVTRDTLLKTATRFAQATRRDAIADFKRPADPARRLRVGYVSADFRNHPVGHFLCGILRNHDRASLEVFCYSNSAIEDEVTARLRGDADHWRSLVGASDQEAAQAIAADGVDILVDLSGHTARNRLPMFALKPAPLQVSWLGYFGTTGLTEIDYVLADRFVAPEGSEPFFTEAVARLPHCYICFTPPDLDIPVATPPVLGGAPFTFGSFNNHIKTSPQAIALWARVLQAVPGSRLLLKTKALGQASARDRLLAQFAEEGVAADRLLLEGAAPRAELLASYNRVDVALDPTPYGGGITTAEALWMGVPVVSLRGETWVGRVTESILAAAGHADLAVATEADYIALAATLARDPRRLEALRTGLRAQVEASPLCDGAGFTHNLEQLYREIWRRIGGG